MKKILAFVIALLAAGSLAASASAASLSPPNGAFTGTGVITISKGGSTFNCTLALTGHVTGGVGVIDTATFSGGPIACSTVFKTGTWTVTAISPGTAVISGFAITSSLIGACGPGSLITTISNAGVISLATAALPSGCQINGVVQTTPPVIVIP
jgi:hypothetical protein